MTNTMVERDDKLVIRLTGDVNLEHAPGIRQLLLNAVTKCKDVVVDLSAVDYIDSSGVANLIEALQAAKTQGTGFALAAVSGKAERVLKLSKLDTVFTFYKNVGAALTTKA